MIWRLAWWAALLATALVAIAAQLDRSARFDPAMAPLAPEPFRGFAQQRLAEAALAQGDPAMAVSLARELVIRRPAPAEHLSLLGRAAVLDGDEDLALAALGAAAERGWRDPTAQNAVAAAALARGEFPVAARRVAALWAIDADREYLDPLTQALLAEPEGRDALALEMAQAGHWRDKFLAPASGLASPADYGDLIAKARQAGADLPCNRLRPAIERLSKEGAVAEAALVRGDCR